MVGFLAPTISDISAAPSAPSSPADLSIGNALGGIGDIINLIGGATGGARPSQTDKDNDALRPHIVEAIRIERLRRSGDMSGPQLAALTTRNRLSALVALPGQSEKVNKALSSIHGFEVDVQQTDPVVELNKTITKFYSDDPKGRERFPALVASSLNPDGTINSEVLGRAQMADFLFQQSEDAADRVDADKLARLKLEGDIGSQESRNLMDVFYRENFVTSAATVKGLGFLATLELQGGGTPADLTQMLILAKDARKAALGRIQARAVGKGLADEEGFDPNIPLVPFDRAISTLTQMIGTPELINNMVRANQFNKIAIVAAAAGVIINPNDTQYFLELMRSQADPQKVKNAVELMEKLAVQPDFIQFGALPVGDHVPGGDIIDPAFSEAAAGLSEAEQKEVVRSNLSGYYTGEGYSGDDPVVREQGIEFFTAALGVLGATGKDISETTFDQTFRPSFLKMYEQATSINDPTTAKFVDVVFTGLTQVLSQIKTNTNLTISNRFAAEYPGLKVIRKSDGVAAIKFASDITPEEIALKALLSKNSFPNSLDGLKSLIALPSPEDSGRIIISSPKDLLAIRDARRIIKALEPNLKYMNKVMKTQRDIELVNQSNEANTGLSLILEDFPVDEERPIISTEKEFEDLDPGQTFFVVIDGRLVPRVKE